VGNQAGTANTTGGLSAEGTPEIIPPTNVTPPNPNAPPSDPPPEDPAGTSDDKPSEEAEGEQKVSLTQKELDDLIKKRLDQQRRQFETAAQKAERERREQIEASQRATQEEQEEKERQQLASQQKFQELSEKAQGSVRTLTTERDALKTRITELEAKVTAGSEVLQKYVEAESQGVPDYILPLLEKMDLPERLAYLIENRDRLKPAPVPIPVPAARQAATVPPTPKAAEIAGPSEAQLAEARAATTEQYRRGLF
jgi:hypothetical protein